MIKEQFSTASAKLDDLSSYNLIDAIVKTRPDLSSQPVVFMGQGANGQAVIFENEVFKFPRIKAAFPFFEQEYKILQHINDMGLPVPTVTTVGTEVPFFGMTRINGEMLTPEKLMAMNEVGQREIAKELAKFMVGLSRAFSEEDAKNILQQKVGCEILPEGIIDALKDMAVQDILGKKYMPSRLLAEEYLAKLSSRKNAVVYGDFNPGNILIDSDTQRFQGIIDFGIVSSSTPESAFMSLRWCYGAGFTKAVCEEFSKIGDQPVDYRDVLLFDIAYNLTLAPHMLNRNDQKGLTCLNYRVFSVLEELKEASVLSPPPVSGLKIKI